MTDEAKPYYAPDAADAALIVEAVNACKSVNPDDPMAVARMIEVAFRALSDIVATRGCYLETPDTAPTNDAYYAYEAGSRAAFAQCADLAAAALPPATSP